MQDSKFWRMVAVVICGGIFYVGHGLHNPSSEPLPSLVNSARAGGVAVDAPEISRARSYCRIYTTDESGTRLYVWDAPSIGAIPKHLATVGVPPKHILPAPEAQPDQK